MEQVILDHLSEELGLDAEQRKALAPIVADTHARMVELKQETAPRELEIFLQAKEAIESHLNASQREKHDRMTRKFLEFRSRMLEPPRKEAP